MQINVTQKVKNVLIEILNLTAETNVSMHSKLKDDLGLDSMSSLTFLITLEENIEGFVVDPDTLEMSDLDTVSSIISYVESQLGDNSNTEKNSRHVESDHLTQATHA